MMKLNKLSLTLLATCTALLVNAQFVHDFSASTQFAPWNSHTTNLDCFLYHPDPLFGVQYSPGRDGLEPVNTNLVTNYSIFFLPALDFNGSAAQLTITYSVNIANSVFSLTWDASTGSIMAGSIPTSSRISSGNQQTVTLNIGSMSGKGRIYLYIAGDDPVIHQVAVTNASYNPTSNSSNCQPVNTAIPACPDSDGDNVCNDGTDDYPNDGTLAYSSTTPWMTWMYEDRYPAYGDFDFNDLVVRAEREAITDANNVLRQLRIKATVLAAGASLKNGWALQLNGIEPSDVTGVSGNDVTDAVMNLSNGTEDGQTHAVIPIFDNYDNVINALSGAFFNTQPSKPSGTADTLEVVINFDPNSNLTLNDLDYNFFSFRTADRGREIHQIGEMPTDLADLSVFGTQQDATNLGSGDTYVSVEGYPWAISSAGTAYPVEKTDIVQTFLMFADWAQSDGSTFPNWHTNPAAGYRAAANVY